MEKPSTGFGQSVGGKGPFHPAPTRGQPLPSHRGAGWTPRPAEKGKRVQGPGGPPDDRRIRRLQPKEPKGPAGLWMRSPLRASHKRRRTPASAPPALLKGKAAALCWEASPPSRRRQGIGPQPTPLRGKRVPYSRRRSGPRPGADGMAVLPVGKGKRVQGPGGPSDDRRDRCPQPKGPKRPAGFRGCSPFAPSTKRGQSSPFSQALSAALVLLTETSAAPCREASPPSRRRQGTGPQPSPAPGRGTLTPDAAPAPRPEGGRCAGSPAPSERGRPSPGPSGGGCPRPHS